MWESALPSDHVKQFILQFVRTAPMNFVQLGRVLPQIRALAMAGIGAICLVIMRLVA